MPGDIIDFSGATIHGEFDLGTPSGGDVVIPPGTPAEATDVEPTDTKSDMEDDTTEGHESDGAEYGGRHIKLSGRVWEGPVFGKVVGRGPNEGDAFIGKRG